MEFPVGLGGVAVVALAVIALARYLLLDHSAADRQQAQLDSMQARITDLETKVTTLEVENRDQRGLKHQALNDLAVARGTLSLASRLAARCTCGALEPLGDLMSRYDEGEHA